MRTIPTQAKLPLRSPDELDLEDDADLPDAAEAVGDQDEQYVREIGPGYVYILSNPSMPDILKIGLTGRPVEDRIRDLSSTGVPTPFEKEYAIHVSDALHVEREVHRRLDAARISANREFFRVPLEEARKHLVDVAMDYFTNAEYFDQFEAFQQSTHDALKGETARAERRARRWRKFALILLLPASLFVLLLVFAVINAVQ